MRIIFMGTPEFAVPALEALIDNGHEIVAVYSQPPRPAGRGKHPRPSPVQARADSLGLTTHTPSSLKSDEEKQVFSAHQADIAVVAAYGLILNAEILEAPRHGCVNIHASLLPRWRGAAPVQRAILAGDKTSGISIMRMERGLDTGPVYARAATPINRKTAGELTEELAEIGGALLCEVLADFEHYVPEAQDDGLALYADKISKSEARLDFRLSAVEVERAVRAFNPVPGAFFELGGERFKILAADIVKQSGDPGQVLDESLTIACSSAAICPLTVQRAGKSAMGTPDLLRGFPIAAGTSLL
jgi:methionyl-tRNA formyltransferase